MAGRAVKTSAGITGPSVVVGVCARRSDHDLSNRTTLTPATTVSIGTQS
jgi:hypothetical protein